MFLSAKITITLSTGIDIDISSELDFVIICKSEIQSKQTVSYKLINPPLFLVFKWLRVIVCYA